MTIYQQRAIELKYKGYTYREISKSMDGKISESMLAKYFKVDGKLYLPYLEYEARMNNWNEETAKTQYKSMLGWTWKMQQQLLKQAFKVKDYRLVRDIINDINDRAGFVVVRKSQVNVKDDREDKLETYEQFTEILRERGIDPRTGLRMATA